MARKPNYRFERQERERRKAAKKAAKAQAKADKAGEAGLEAEAAGPEHEVAATDEVAATEAPEHPTTDGA